MPAVDAALLADFMREPRSVRRAISRDLARANPVAPKRPQHGAVARWVNRGLPPKRSPRACPLYEMHRDRARRAGFVEPRIEPYTHHI